MSRKKGLLQELVTRPSQPGYLVLDLSEETFLTAVTGFSVPRHRFFAAGEVYLECIRVAEKAVLRRFAKAALEPGTDVELSR